MLTFEIIKERAVQSLLSWLVVGLKFTAQ